MYDDSVRRRLLLQWFILVGVMAFVLFVVWHQGLIALLLGYDRIRSGYAPSVAGVSNLPPRVRRDYKL